MSLNKNLSFVIWLGGNAKLTLGNIAVSKDTSKSREKPNFMLVELMYQDVQ
jgi:hypothetical protein